MVTDAQLIAKVIEVAKEFGGGFGAYWTHHVFHKVWRRFSR